MKKVRLAVFETNSSNTHSITIVPKADFERWQKGELVLIDENLMTEEEARKAYEEDDYAKRWYKTYEDWVDNNQVETYEDWENDEYLETYVTDFTSASGDEIVIFGKFGRDG